LEEDIVTVTPEPSPVSDPAPEPEPTPPPEPEPSPELSEPESSTDPGVTVVSVDELIDRLTQNGSTGEEEAAPAEPAAEEPDVGEGEVVAEDVVPGLIGDAIDLLLDIRGGMKNVESIERTVNHPLLTTPFQDYTVTEGLLLLLLLCFFIKACMNMVRRAFSWLL